MDEWAANIGEYASTRLSEWLVTTSARGVGFILFALAVLLAIAMVFTVFRWRARRVARLQAIQNEMEITSLTEKLTFSHAQLQDRGDQLLELERLLEHMRQFQSKASASDAIAASLSEQLTASREKLITVENELNALKVDSSSRESALQARQQAMQEKLDLLQSNKEQLSVEFQNLANKIFDEKSQRFSTSSKQLLDTTLSPLKSQLDDFRKKVEESYALESKERHLLKGEIDRLREESVRISEDANNLTRALKHDNKAQGNWGELSLMRALETCGLQEGSEFRTQVVVDQEGARQIPDVVVHLPGEKDIVIDSKMSLLAYTRYFETEEEVQKEAALSDHVASVRAHIRGLSKKNYSSLLGINSLDYVMLYIPVEGASTLALQRDPELWNYAYSRNIVLVGPSNLLAVLRSVETIWRHERQNKNAEKIAQEAGKLHDQFVLFAQSLEDVGKQLSKASDAYEKATERLSSGRGNLVKRIENLQKLGAKTQRNIPESLRDRAGLDNTSSESIGTLELVQDAPESSD